MNYLIDTNVVIYFLGKIVLSQTALSRIDAICSAGQHLSIITKLELLGYNFQTPETEASTKKFVAASRVHQINPEIEDETIKLRKLLKIKLPDAIIAATAVVHGFTLVTGNFKDFGQVSGLHLLNPFDL